MKDNSSERHRVLFVDDDPDLQALLAAWCDGWKLDCFSLLDPAGILDAAEAFDPHLIFLDVAMPNLSGYQVLEKLKCDPRLRRVPVVMMSATEVSVPDKVGGLTRGAVDYLCKPLHKDELHARITGYLKHFASPEREAGDRELEAIRQTATYLNHSINNLLQTIQFTAEWAAELDAGDLEAVRRHESIIQCVRSIADIIQRLKQIKTVVSQTYTHNEQMLDLEKSTGASLGLEG